MVYSICKVYDEAGIKLISYEYDAYGNCYESYYNGGSGTSAYSNPFRYRGYYYDAEIGMYYLQCRYYAPDTSRFINSDEGLILTVSKNILNANIFVYCHNNPINEVDCFGYLSFWKRAYYLVHGIFLVTTGLLAIISAIRKGFVVAALGSFTANLIASLVGTAPGFIPLGQYWAAIIAVTMIISLLWHFNSMLYNIPKGVAKIKKALS